MTLVLVKGGLSSTRVNIDPDGVHVTSNSPQAGLGKCVVQRCCITGNICSGEQILKTLVYPQSGVIMPGEDPSLPNTWCDYASRSKGNTQSPNGQRG